MLNYGMVGGGPGAFIGDVHRKAIRIDELAKLTAGCFSRNVEKSRKFGKELGIEENCLYSNYEEMAKTEASKKDGISFVVCVTPNVSHFMVCKTFLENGINVVCDKPLTFTSHQARILTDIVKQKKLLFAVTYAYTGYPAIKQMREMIKKGDLGKMRFVNAEYPQDWLAMPLSEDNKLAPWRMDPKVSGITNCLGDIGTHIENLAAFVTGLKIKRVSAHLDSLVEGRLLDDNAVVNIEYEGGAKGLYWSSQIAFGNDNALRLRIYGEKGGLEWVQENPDHFIFTPCDRPKEIWSRGRDTFENPAQKYSRLPAGHQEGLFEAFANIYKSYITALNKKINGEELTVEDIDFPTVEMGFDGVNYIEKCFESNKNNSAWIKINE
jgi:predicted dehydrogenase